jgi:hypothetical protein
MTTQDGASNFNIAVAHPARRYNYWLGGKDNFAADRESATLIQAKYPAAAIAARTNRIWMHQVVRRLVAEAEVTQLIDIGVGLPVSPNVHEIAQYLAPAARILYVDNDPIVMVHARALLTSTPQGATDYAETDLRDPGKILSEARKLLDFSQPIGVLLLAVLHFVPDSEQPDQAVATLMDAMPSGSYLAITHGTGDFMTAGQIAAIAALPRDKHGPLVSRTREQIARFFTGLDLVEPGLAPTADLFDAEEPAVTAADCAAYAGLAAKP